MPALTTQQIDAILAKIMRTIECPGPLLKAQLRAVLVALDDHWESAGAQAANLAIPQPQRGLLAARNKAYLFQQLLEEKYKVS